MNEYEIALRQFLEDEGYTNIEISEGYDENNFEVETDEEDMEFFVGTYDESYEAAKQDVLDLLDEMGIDALSPDYDYSEYIDDFYFVELCRKELYDDVEDLAKQPDPQGKYANEFIKELMEGEDFENIGGSFIALNKNKQGLLDLSDDEEDYDYFMDEYVNEKMEKIENTYGSYNKWYLEYKGSKAFKDTIYNNPFECLDYESMAEDIVDTDGMGNFLASYDGVENEVSVNGTDYYIFRTN